jgi:hypothetical protein
MIAALRQRFSLTPEQRALLRGKLIEGRYTADELIAQLAPLARMDRLGDQGRNVGCGLLIALGVGLATSLFAAIAMDRPPTWLWGLAGVFGALIAGVAALRSALSGMDDRENYLREVALPFLAALRLDVPAGAALSVRIDFSPIQQQSKLACVDRPPLPPGFSKLVNSHYRNPWFSGSAPLAVGGRLHWRVTDLLRESSRTRRSASGKHKMKTKTKRKTRLDVTLSLPARRHAAADAADPRVAVHDRRVEVTLARRLSANGAPPNVAKALIDLVALAFGQFRPVSHPSTKAMP